MPRTCCDCGGPRELAFGARCNACQRIAADAAFEQLAEKCGAEFAERVRDAAHQVAAEDRAESAPTPAPEELALDKMELELNRRRVVLSAALEELKRWKPRRKKS